MCSPFFFVIFVFFLISLLNDKTRQGKHWSFTGFWGQSQVDYCSFLPECPGSKKCIGGRGGGGEQDFHMYIVHCIIILYYRKRKRARSLTFYPHSLDLHLSWNTYCRGISHFDIIIDWSATLTHDKYYGWGFNTTRTRPLLFSPNWEVMLALRHGQWLIVNGGGGGQTQFWLFL